MSDAPAAPRAGPAPYPGSGASWFLVAMLTIAYVFSFVDRYILGLLIEPIKADLGLSDEQIGLVLGPAFGLIYAFSGLFIGWFVDNWRRAWIVGIGMTVWSLATAFSGLAANFWQLFLARMTIGAGESVLSPSAFSMIADSFPEHRRGKPIAFYTAALTLGAGIASLIGGGVLLWAKTTDGVSLPFLGLLAPWQLVFMTVGTPGLLLAVYFFVVREPARRPTVGGDAALQGASVFQAWSYVAKNGATYFTFASLVMVMTIIAYSQGYLPSTFERVWGWERELYAFANGAALLVIGPATIFFTGCLSDRWMQAGVRDAPFRLLVAGYLVMAPTGVLAMVMPTGVLAFAVLGLNTIGIGMISAVGVTALLLITPSQIRGQALALYYMTISLSGLFLGPTTVGVLSTRVFGEENLNLAVGAAPLIYGVGPLVLIPVTRRLYLKQMERLRAADSDATAAAT